MDNKNTKHGAVATAITVGVLIGVILFNVLFTFLGNRFLWVVDTSPNDLTGISQVSQRFLEEVDGEANHVTIYFLADPDELENYELVGHKKGETNTWGMSYIYHLAKRYERDYDFIRVGILDLADDADYIRQNFAMTIGSAFSPLTVVVDNEIHGLHSYRTYTRDDFYAIASSGAMYFQGEDRFTSAILSLTGANPTVYFLEGHGEKVGPAGDASDLGEASALADLFREAGFLVKKVNLSKEDFAFSEDPGLVGSSAVAVIYGPTSDFICDDAAGINEMTKLSHFLNQRNCNLMVFKDPGPVLPNLEEYLTDYYGITFNNDVVVADPSAAESAAISGDGKTFFGDYELRTASPGSGLVSSLTSLPTMPGAYFSNACSITLNERWSDDSESTTIMEGNINYKVGAVLKAPLLSALEKADGSFRTFEKNVYEAYAAKYYDAMYQEIYPAVYEEVYGKAYETYYEDHKEDFEKEGLSQAEIEKRCKDEAEKEVKEEAGIRMDRLITLEVAQQPAIMTLTHATWMYQPNETANFFALACGSTAFASREALGNAAYGNRDVMFSAVYRFSRNVLPYDIDVIAIENPSSLQISGGAANGWTVFFVAILPLAVLGLGTAMVIRRRKHN